MQVSALCGVASVGSASRPASVSGWLALLCALVLLWAQTLGQLHHTIHIPLAAKKIHDAQQTPQSQQLQHEAHGGDESENDEHRHDHGQGHDHDCNSARNHDQHARASAAQASPLSYNKPFLADLLVRLFDHDSGSENCRLIDGAASAGVPNHAVSAVYIAQAAIFLIAKSQVTATARAAELFEARGPPSAAAALRAL